MSEPSGPRCRCGHTVDHVMVAPEPRYSLWGWFLVTMGATPTPRQIVYRCTHCQTILGSTRDKEALRKFS